MLTWYVVLCGTRRGEGKGRGRYTFLEGVISVAIV